MATEVLMPQMGESIVEGTITQWLVEVGQRVVNDTPISEIYTKSSPRASRGVES